MVVENIILRTDIQCGIEAAGIALGSCGNDTTVRGHIELLRIEVIASVVDIILYSCCCSALCRPTYKSQIGNTETYAQAVIQQSCLGTEIDSRTTTIDTILKRFDHHLFEIYLLADNIVRIDDNTACTQCSAQVGSNICSSDGEVAIGELSVDIHNADNSLCLNSDAQPILNRYAGTEIELCVGIAIDAHTREVVCAVADIL